MIGGVACGHRRSTAWPSFITSTTRLFSDAQRKSYLYHRNISEFQLLFLRQAVRCLTAVLRDTRTPVQPGPIPGSSCVSEALIFIFRLLICFLTPDDASAPPDLHFPAHTHPVPAGFEAETTGAFVCDVFIEQPHPVETRRQSQQPIRMQTHTHRLMCETDVCFLLKRFNRSLDTHTNKK